MPSTPNAGVLSDQLTEVAVEAYEQLFGKPPLVGVAEVRGAGSQRGDIRVMEPSSSAR